MPKVTAKAGALAAQNNKLQGKPAPEKISDFLAREETQRFMLNAIGDKKEVQKFVSSIVSATSANQQLMQCSRNSILSSAMLANALNMSLSPQLGLCYLVPFKNKAKYDKDGNMLKDESYEATFVLGYKGYLQLAIRSGYYKTINVSDVREGELKHYNPLTDEIEIEVIQDESARLKAPVIGYYAYLRLTNGFEKAMYWSYEKMLDHADTYSAAFSAKAYSDIRAGKVPEKDMWKYSSFWYKSFDQMAMKTMLRQLISKWGIMSIDMQTAYEYEVKAEEENLKSQPTMDIVEVPEGNEPTDENLNDGSDSVAVDSETGEILGGVPDGE